MNDIAPRDRLIVALDFPSVDEARDMVATLGDAVTFYKIGLELVLRGGLDLARDLAAGGKDVFLDMKLLDIGNTVEKAVESAAATGARFLTIHGHDTKTIKAAAAGAIGSGMKVLSVTVLTNLDRADLAEQGIDRTPAEMVLHRARLALAAGCDGVVASGLEAAEVRRATAADFLIVTPGIRMPQGETGDQTRIATPASAIRDGADYLVVGRPITQAGDPAAAARLFTKEIVAAL